MCYSIDYRMLKEERTKTEAARLAEQPRAEMVEWLLTAALAEEASSNEAAEKTVATAK
jgi:hypothetical protein